MSVAIKDAKSCPFCGSSKLDYSIKTKGEYYHCVVYCKTCRAYGPRTLLKLKDNEHLYGGVGYNMTTLSKYNALETALEAWNSRG